MVHGHKIIRATTEMDDKTSMLTKWGHTKLIPCYTMSKNRKIIDGVTEVRIVVTLRGEVGLRQQMEGDTKVY